jgi:hypothetical protein
VCPLVLPKRLRCDSLTGQVIDSFPRDGGRLEFRDGALLFCIQCSELPMLLLSSVGECTEPPSPHESSEPCCWELPFDWRGKWPSMPLKLASEFRCPLKDVAPCTPFVTLLPFTRALSMGSEPSSNPTPLLRRSGETPTLRSCEFVPFVFHPELFQISVLRLWPKEFMVAVPLTLSLEARKLGASVIA